MVLKNKRIGVAMTGSFCTYTKAFEQIERLLEEGAILQTIFSGLAAELGKLPLEVYPSQGNFLLLRAVDKNIRQMLFDQGIKVRDCSRFYGLNSEYCRIAIRAHDDNRKLIKALSNIFS